MHTVLLYVLSSIDTCAIHLCFADSMKDILLLLLLHSLLLWELVLGANVTYDHRALVLNGARRVLISGTIHYPRSTPEVSDDDDDVPLSSGTSTSPSAIR